MSGFDSCLLSEDLRNELGNEDASNQLVVTRKRRRKVKKKKKTSMERDRKAEQAERKKEQTVEMQALYVELQRHALPPDQLLKLQEICQKKKKKPKKQKTEVKIVNEATHREQAIPTDASFSPGDGLPTKALPCSSTCPDEATTDTDPVIVCHPDSQGMETDDTVKHSTVLQTPANTVEIKPEPTEDTISVLQQRMELESPYHLSNKTLAAANVTEDMDQQAPSAIPQVQNNQTSNISATEERSEPHRVIFVSRTAEVEASRSALPIIGYEQEIMEAIHHHDVVVVCGQTGCGKTTQVPQFLFEAGYGHREFLERSGLVGVTQPRRIATTSTAARVARELGYPLGTVVGYHIRHERRLSEATAVKFMTDGVLLRELQSDFALMSYSALIIDEAHERSLNTDLMLGMVSRIVRLRRRLKRPPLKVIIMSATLEAGTLLTNPRLFNQPPVIEVPSRQYSVTVHFSKKTEEDYEMAAMKKVIRIHRQLPPGGILVFLTGKREIDRFCVDLRRRLAFVSRRSKLPSSDYEFDDASSEEDVEILPGNTDDVPSDIGGTCEDAMVLPLYAMLPPERQSRVFVPVPEGRRLIVVATNVAETSITIPNVRYVVDSGRAKHKRLHSQSNISRFAVDWISKASATQRSGRAGRTCPGHCYRLYSSAQFERFSEHEAPEIACVALEELVLLMKSMGLTRVEKFPFPTVPETAGLAAAETRLRAISAIDDDGVTALGRQLVQLPIPPRQARMVFAAKKMEEDGFEGVTLYALSLASVMSVESPFLTDGRKKNKAVRRLFLSPVSDPITILNAYCHYRRHPQPLVFCREYHLHGKLMTEIASLDRQLRRLFLDQLGIKSRSFLIATPSSPPTEMVDRLRRCILTGWCDQIARKLTVESKRRVGYQSQIQTDAEDGVHLHPLSSIRKSAPEFVVYVHAMKTEERTYIHGATKVEPEWIFSAAEPLCTVQEPLISPAASYDVAKDAVMSWYRVIYGRHDWELPPQALPCEDPDICTAQFALALLKGQILPSAAFEHLVMPATYAASLEARFNKRLGLLLTRLKDEGIWNRRSLIDRLSIDADFLKDELSLWIHPDHRSALKETSRDRFKNTGGTPLGTSKGHHY